MAAQTLDELLAERVIAAVEQALAPYLRRLAEPEALAYSVSQAAAALGTSDKTVRALVKAGHLATVPHIEGRVLIPVADLKRYAESQMTKFQAVAS